MSNTTQKFTIWSQQKSDGLYFGIQLEGKADDAKSGGPYKDRNALADAIQKWHFDGTISKLVADRAGELRCDSAPVANPSLANILCREALESKQTN